MDETVDIFALPIHELRDACKTLREYCDPQIKDAYKKYAEAKNMDTTALLAQMTDLNLADKVYIRKDGCQTLFQDDYVCLLASLLERLANVFTSILELKTVSWKIFMDRLGTGAVYFDSAINRLSNATALAAISQEEKRKIRVAIRCFQAKMSQ
jgi:hypothetical protein